MISPHEALAAANAGLDHAVAILSRADRRRLAPVLPMLAGHDPVVINLLGQLQRIDDRSGRRCATRSRIQVAHTADRYFH
jgi:hypothetical protein